MKTASASILAFMVATSALAQGFVGQHPVTIAPDQTLGVDGSQLSVTNPITVGTEPTVAQIPYFLAVSRGLVAGVSGVNKFGIHGHHEDYTRIYRVVWL